MTSNTTVAETGSWGLFQIQLRPNDVKCIGDVVANTPLFVSLCIGRDKDKKEGFDWFLQISDVKDGPDYASFKSTGGSDNLGEIIETIVENRRSNTTATVDLRFLHGVMQYLSPEEKKRKGYVFDADHATLLEELYARWVATILSNNVQFSATIRFDVGKCRMFGRIKLEDVVTNNEWTFSCEAKLDMNEWGELEEAFRLTSAA